MRVRATELKSAYELKAESSGLNVELSCYRGPQRCVVPHHKSFLNKMSLYLYVYTTSGELILIGLDWEGRFWATRDFSLYRKWARSAVEVHVTTSQLSFQRSVIKWRTDAQVCPGMVTWLCWFRDGSRFRFFLTKLLLKLQRLQLGTFYNL